MRTFRNKGKGIGHNPKGLGEWLLAGAQSSNQYCIIYTVLAHYFMVEQRDRMVLKYTTKQLLTYNDCA